VSPRDDLDDEGAWLYAEIVRKVHELNPNTGVENLTPDFSGKPDLLAEVFEARPEVFAHNLETVPRIFKRIRPAFRYERSLEVIRAARDFGLVTKSNLILGMGETAEEVRSSLTDLKDAGCDIITITQYLRPTSMHHPIERWVKPRSSWSTPTSPRTRLRRGHVRTVGPLVLPLGPAVRRGQGRPR
jgi:lipoic acid synthetase